MNATCEFFGDCKEPATKGYQQLPNPQSSTGLIPVCDPHIKMFDMQPDELVEIELVGGHVWRKQKRT